MTASRPSPDGTPFEVLGLPASETLTDDDVRSAWRRIAAAAHPDRPGGGDPARFAAASAAYTLLRTRAGRGEALADRAGDAARQELISPPPRASSARDFTASVVDTAQLTPAAGGSLSRAVTRIRRGRPAVLAVRLLIVAAVSAGSAALVGSAPATPALITGALTWLLLTGRHDLAPPV
jgi:hypothetical protein